MDKISLKAARANANLTLKQASDSVGINIDTLSRYENGKALPRVDVLAALCKLYKCSMDAIFFD